MNLNKRLQGNWALNSHVSIKYEAIFTFHSSLSLLRVFKKIPMPALDCIIPNPSKLQLSIAAKYLLFYITLNFKLVIKYL